MTEYLSQLPGSEVFIVDNASTYPPLLEWYRKGLAKIIRLDRNIGHKAPWESGSIEREAGEYYVVSDPDLDLGKVPKDVLERLQAGLQRYPDVKRCGLSLEIEDLPDDSPLKAKIINWENQFWTAPVDGGYYDAPVDTTFAMYSKERPLDWPPNQCLRTERPYIARHHPWYLTPANFNDEEEYYIRHCRTSCHWTKLIYYACGKRLPYSMFNQADEFCGQPELWTALDPRMLELETIELIKSLVLATKPQTALEIGCGFGLLTKAIGEGLKANGQGHCLSVQSIAGDAMHIRTLCENLPVEVLLEEPLSHLPEVPVDFAIFNSADPSNRLKEFWRYYPFLEGLVIFSDTSLQGGLWPEIEKLTERRIIQCINLKTPRGLCIAQVLK